MKLCVLRVSGTLFDADVFLAASDLVSCNKWKKGEPRHEGCHIDSGFNIDVCEVDSDGLKEQTEKAIEFLKNNFAELKRLMEYTGVEDGVLDFAINKRDAFAQFDRFPAELIRLAGSLGLGIELSQYAVSEEDE